MAWAKPQFSRSQVDDAGDALCGSVTRSTRADALVVVGNWRSSHAYPLLATRITLGTRAKRVDKNALIAQRLKRLPSLEAKLKRFGSMKLSQMQDIGGCRAVLRSVRAVDELVRAYAKSVAKNPRRVRFVKKYDYIANPKTDGYRSVHLIYKYRSSARKHAVYNGLRIEIQIRSKLQHIWATAVETVSIFTGQALKSNVGDERWKRFFKLMGSALALKENRPTVPGTPGPDELRAELRVLAEELQVEPILRGWGAAVSVLTERMTDAHAYIILLEPRTKEVLVQGFGKDEMAGATDEYLSIETQRPGVQAVLVSVDSMAALKKAYPSFYLDTDAFIDEVRSVVGNAENIAIPSGQ